MLMQRLPVSAPLAIGAAVLWLLAGLIAGVLSAVHEGRFLDRFLAGLTLGGMSIPNYVLALVLQFVLVVVRSEEHTSELQSRGHLVCRLLLENKNTKKQKNASY